MLVTWTVAKKGLGDMQLDNPHVPSPLVSRKTCPIWTKKAINSRSRYHQHLKRGGIKPSKVEIPYTHCKTNTYIPGVFVMPKEKENKLKASNQLLNPVFLSEFRSEALKQKIWLVHSREPRRARFLQAGNSGPWVQSTKKENSQIPEPGASATAPSVFALQSHLCRRISPD